jgi:hypothetical protein
MRPETGTSPQRIGTESGIASASGSGVAYEPPSFEVICLACEISAYAPDGDQPLF